MTDREPVSRSTAVERLCGYRSDLLGDTPAERVELDAIAGRTLAESVSAPRDVPPHDYATMDGYAVAGDEEGPLAVVGEVAPEDDPPTIDAGEAVRIATGAPLPARADGVLKREDATVEDGRVSGPALTPGENVHRRASTVEAGERVFAAGDRLAPRHAALLRDLGIDTVSVHRRFSVAVVATGTEIHEGRQPDRDSDFLAGLVQQWGHDPADRTTVPDDPDAMKETIEDATADHDAVLTTGGTGFGSADHSVGVLADHETVFDGVRLRPGRLVTAAVVDGALVVALPGKPFAAHTAAVLVVRSLFTGETRLPTVTADATHRVGIPDDEMEYAVPFVVADGRATPLGHAASPLALYDERFAPGLVAASTRTALADGVVLAESNIDPGERVEIVPYGAVE